MVSDAESVFFSRFLGVTPPISTSDSNDREKEVTITLMEELRRQNTFESEEEARRRCVCCFRESKPQHHLPFSNRLCDVSVLRLFNGYSNIRTTHFFIQSTNSLLFGFGGLCLFLALNDLD
jgi:hypothetical protein